MAHHVVLCTASDTAEGAVVVLLLHMSLKQQHSGKSNTATSIVITLCFGVAFVAPKFEITVLALYVPPQGTCSVEAGVASVVTAWVRRLAYMGRSDVSLERLVLSEALDTVPIAAAAVAVGALVDESMAAKSCVGHEGLSATGFGASVLSIVGMGTLDVLGQVLLFEVVFVAVIVGALERAIVGVGTEVSSKTSRAVEGLGATGECAPDGLEVGGEAARSTSRGSVDTSCCYRSRRVGVGEGSIGDRGDRGRVRVEFGAVVAIHKKW